MVWSTLASKTVSAWATARIDSLLSFPSTRPIPLPTSSTELLEMSASLKRLSRNSTRFLSSKVGAGISPIITKLASSVSLSSSATFRKRGREDRMSSKELAIMLCHYKVSHFENKNPFNKYRLHSGLYSKRPVLKWKNNGLNNPPAIIIGRTFSHNIYYLFA